MQSIVVRRHNTTVSGAPFDDATIEALWNKATRISAAAARSSGANVWCPYLSVGLWPASANTVAGDRSHPSRVKAGLGSRF